MKKHLGLIMVLALVIALDVSLLLSGCGSTPSRSAVILSDSSQVTVEAALGAWDDYIVQFHPPIERQIAVKQAWEKYRDAQLLVLDTALILKEAETAGGNVITAKAALNSAIQNAGTTLADLFTLLRQFGLKL